MTQQRKTGFTAEKIAIIALLTAMQIVLGNLVQVPLLNKQFSFGFLPIAIGGALYGVPAAVMIGGLGDFFGAHLFPVGAYFPGFTLTNILVGLCYALFLRGHKPNWLRIAASCTVASLCNLFLNTLWLSILYTKNGYWGWFLTRWWFYLVEIPLQTVLIYLTLAGLSRWLPHAFPSVAIHHTQTKE